MSRLKKLKRFAGYYSEVNKSRAQATNLKWRVIVVLLLIASILVVKDYLADKYAAEFTEPAGLAFLVLDKAMYWFIAGIITGIAFAWLMFEGEFVIMVWRLASRIERDAMAQLTGGKPKAKPVVARRRKR